MEIEHRKVEVKKNLNINFDYEKGEICLFGARTALTNVISSKHLIDSFWAGVLSKYFSQQLKCASFSYNEKEGKLHCTITA